MKESKLRQMLGGGSIGEFYTLKGYFLKVTPCFPIDKVKFAFVEKGTRGSGFDVYVDTDKFDLLCEDILNYSLAKKIAADTGEYPGAWKHVTGENASKELAIGKSSKGGIVVQGRDKEGKKNAFVPIPEYDALRVMAHWFRRVAGLESVSGYYAELVALFHKGASDRNKWHSYSDEDEAPAQPTEQPEPEANMQPPESAKPIPEGARAIKIKLLSEITRSDENAALSYAEVEDAKGKRGGMWFVDAEVEGRREELNRAAAEGRMVEVACRVDKDEAGNAYVWFVA